MKTLLQLFHGTAGRGDEQHHAGFRFTADMFEMRNVMPLIFP